MSAFDNRRIHKNRFVAPIRQIRLYFSNYPDGEMCFTMWEGGKKIQTSVGEAN